jgi:hypothetical protein
VDALIKYHEPVKQRGVTNRATQPVTQIFVTGKGELAEADAYQTYTGTVAGVGNGEAVSEREMRAAIGRMLRRTHAGSLRVLTAEQFQTIWSRLATAGLFTLPARKGGDEPTQEPYFLIRAGDERWIIERPSVASPPRENDPNVARVKVWGDVKKAFFAFMNE